MNFDALPKQAAARVCQLKPSFKPAIAVILGSGLGPFANHLENAVSIPYQDLPGFPELQVVGHAGRLICGSLYQQDILCFQGRVHGYEGKSMDTLKNMIRTAKSLGCQSIIVSNAAGSLRQDAPPGDLVLITDHINFQGTNPLIGKNDDDFGPRFVSMDKVYDEKLRGQLLAAASMQDIYLHQGIYFATIGPVYETPAEIRAFRILGADVIGMSTVPDVIIARHCELKVACISVITNYAAGMTDEILSHEGTLHHAHLACEKFIRLIKQFIQNYSS